MPDDKSKPPLPTDWTPLDGYNFYLICCPNSSEYGGILRQGISGQSNLWKYDISVGDPDEFKQEWAKLVNGVWVMSGDILLSHLDRVATALEAIEAKTPDVKTLQEIIDDVDNSSILANAADLAEVLAFLKDVLPGFPNLNLPLGDFIQAFTTYRFRASIINLLEDIALSQRAQSTAQLGTDGHGIYGIFNTLTDYLLLPAGFLGKAVWLWQRVKPSDVPEWTTWVNSIIGALLGNIRSALYDQDETLITIHNKLDELKTSLETDTDLQDIVARLDEINEILGGDPVP